MQKPNNYAGFSLNPQSPVKYNVCVVSRKIESECHSDFIENAPISLGPVVVFSHLKLTLNPLLRSYRNSS